MDIETAKAIINDDTLSDEQISVLIMKAEKEALNHYFWKADDTPDDEVKEAFLDKWEYEIYGIAKAMNASDSRDGLTSFDELGVSRTWGNTRETTIDSALSAIPRKAYVI